MGCELCKQPRSFDVHEVSELNGDTKVGVGAPTFGGSAPSKTLAFLGKVQLFKRLPQDQHPILATACQPVDFPRNSVLIKQGDAGSEFFVIVSGQVSVSIDGKTVATLKSGDYFGENALLRNEPRNATITADTPVSALRISREKFQTLGLNDKLYFPKRQAVGGGGGRNLITKPPSKKTEDDRRIIVECLKNNTSLNTVVTMDDAKCKLMVDCAWEESVESGKNIIKQGDDEADYFYVVKEGTFEITIDSNPLDGKSAETATQSVVEHVGTVSKGGSFGELALLYFAPRAATVKATTNAVVWVFDRTNFKTMIAMTGEDSAKEKIKYLDKSDVFKSLKQDEKMEIAKNLSEANFNKGEKIFEQGEKGDVFYILYDGVLDVIVDGKVVSTLKGTSTNTEIFGERALIKAEARAATINVVSATAKTLCMDKVSFDMLLGPLEQINQRGASGTSKVGKGIGQRASVRTSTQIFRKDLTRLGLLGCGGFGAVELVEHHLTKETYALKAMSKGYVLKCGMKKSVIQEKDIQLMCDSPFIVKLYETYNGDQTLYFLLELALGGELYATYSKKGFHGSIPHARFYIAGTVYAFEHLHEKKIVYRDLKPENLLLTETGTVKLTDMGLAKVVAGKTYTTCGTPDYFAPELIASTGHSHPVDWWGLGILTFELMSGHPPFESAAPMQIYSKVTKGILKVAFPPKLKGACEDLVKNLCAKDPSERLPVKKGGIENIKKHAWYSGFDWDAMRDGTLEAPYKPIVKSKKDIKNFNARKEDMPPQVRYKDDGTGWDKDFATST